MKSYLLQPVQSRDDAVAALNSVLPGQSQTWLLKDSEGDTVAYYSLDESDHQQGMFSIVANINDRHFNRDTEVISVLRNIVKATGGVITDDWNNQIEL